MATMARLLTGIVLVSAVATHAAVAQLPQQAPSPTRPDSTQLSYQVFLVGNTGAGTRENLAPTLRLLHEKLAVAGEAAAVVFLGDLLPCCGMPQVGAPKRAEAEERLFDLIETVQGFSGRVVFIPGDNDWGRPGDEGRLGATALVRMEEFLETTLDRGNVFRPDEGFPGPDEIRLTRDIRLVALNTNWLLTEHERPTGDAGDFDVTEDGDVYVELEDLLLKRSNRDMLVVGHHPIYSNGSYGGHYEPKGHLFPLTMALKWAYLPLPIIGTMAMSVRRNAGNEQHFSHTQNRWMRESLERTLLVHEDFIYVSAHDNSLQHFWTRKLNRSQHFLVSGSAAKSEYTSQANRALLASDERGFMVLHYYDEGSIWSEAWSVSDGGQLIYEAALRGPVQLDRDVSPTTTTGPAPDYRDSSLVLAAEPGYKGTALQRFFLGSNHRDAWITPVEVPYFDVATEQGGLTPLKRGGGMQSISVRFENSEGKQYVLRSVNKDGRRFLPPEIQYTFVAPISQDFLSYAHPYGALIIPSLSDAVGVYHTNPKLVYVPSDPRLGEYQDLIGNMLMLFEERPNGDWSSEPSFGNSDEIVGTYEVYRNIMRDQDYTVDARAFARARLFDMWLSDWDRHKDQWRWASFEPPDGKGKIYRPIPRDRDQAFNRLTFFGHGLLAPYIKFQSFEKKYRNIPGLTNNAKELDHRIFSPLSLDDFRSIAESVSTALTDEVIESAFRQWPDAIFALRGEEMIETGKARRDRLTDVAEELYKLHARSVDVVGSNKHERFDVTRLNDDSTEVVVFKMTREGEIREEIYRRVIHRGETKEIVLYGLGGDDRFVFSGRVAGGIKIYAVGGTGVDTYIDYSTGGKIVVHDSHGENDIRPGQSMSVELSDDPERYEYTRFFEFPKTYPIALAFYTTDDGLIVGGGVADINQGFGKSPYGNRQIVSGSYATETNALRFNWTGLFKQTYGWWDQVVSLGLRNDDNFTNFYTLGNETGGDVPLDTFRIRMGGGDLELPVERTFEMGAFASFAPFLRMTNVRDDQTQILEVDQPGLSKTTLDAQWYMGLASTVDFAFHDDMTNPRQGFRWPTTLAVNLGVANAPDHYATLGSEVVTYMSLRTRRQIGLALRVGGAYNFGTFPFYGANTIGNNGTVRGYRGDRFSGRSSLYGNAELRLELFRLGGVLLPGAIGMTGFFDVGRVWTDGESSNKWHPGYGAGIWYDFSGEFVLRLEVGFSEEDRTWHVGPGFFF